jgi:CRISPR system Cascade subunit CasE
MSVWLARLALNTRHRAARTDLADAVALHRRVMSLFPDRLGDNARQAARILFRLDDTRDGPCLLVQAALQPSPERLPVGYSSWDTRQLQPLLNALTAGMPVRYRLAGNPTKRAARDDEHHKTGQMLVLTGADADAWWARRAATAGLALQSAVAEPQPAAAGRHDHPIRHAITRFDGVALVTDPDAARTAVLAGVGKGKSYGCGLLSLAPHR